MFKHTINFILSVALICIAILWIKTSNPLYEQLFALMEAIIGALLAASFIFGGANKPKVNPLYLPVDHLPEPGPMAPMSRFPAERNQQFVGRVEEMLDIAFYLQEGNSVVILGSDGIGKTHLAWEWVYRYGACFEGGVFWIDCSNPSSLVDELASCGSYLNITGNTTQAIADQTIRAWQEPVPRLLVFDDCPSKALLAQWTPKSGGCRIISTTHSQDWLCGDGEKAIHLDPLNDGQSVAMLQGYRAKLNPQEPHLTDLVKALAGFPFAIHLAGSYLASHERVSVEAFMAEIMPKTKVQWIKTLFVHGFDQLEPGALKAEEMESVDTLAMIILGRMTLLTWGQTVPQEVVVQRLQAPVGWIDDALHRLFQLGLLERLSDQVRIHKLLGVFLIEAIGTKELCDILPGLADCLEAVIAEDKATLLAKQWVAQQMFHIGDLLSQWGFTEESINYLERAMEIWDSTMDWKSLTYAVRCNNLGEIYRDRHERPSDMGKAARLFEKAVQIGESTLAADSPQLIQWLENWGKCLWEIGFYGKAEPIFRRLLEHAEQKESPTGISVRRNDLGMVLRDLGRLEEARDLFQQALASAQQTYQPGHPIIAVSQSNLGMVLQDLGRLEEARDLLQLALASDQQSYEPGHPSIAIRQSNLGRVLRDLGRMEEARDLLQQALASDQQSFEPGHPTIATRQNNLATLLWDLGSRQEARDLMQQAFDALLQKLGPDHPHTKTAKRSLDVMDREANDSPQ